jgi:hypothetical protein
MERLWSRLGLGRRVDGRRKGPKVGSKGKAAVRELSKTGFGWRERLGVQGRSSQSRTDSRARFASKGRTSATPTAALP